MSDSENDPLSSLLSSFALGPSWARATGGTQQERAPRKDAKSDERPPRRDDRGGDDRRDAPRGRDRDRDGDRRFQGRGGRPDDRRDGPPRHEEILPAENVRVSLVPDAHAVHLIGKEVHQVARVYPLFDVAKILLAERGRCRAVFEVLGSRGPMFRGRQDDSLFLTRDEALRHLWQSELREKFIEEETIEVDPPSGNFQLVARCGLSGEWLGPPNFHSYQVNLRRLHRERFANMPFAAYSSKVRTERGEEAVNAWLETMKKKTRWRIKGDGDEAWIDDVTEAQRALAARCFDEAFAETRHAEVLASIPPKNLSASLMVSLKLAGNHARNHPAILIPAVCKAVEAEHLPVFKRQGKLYTGPARPHPLPLGATLAERPGIMVEWIRANKPAKLEGLWNAVLPEGSTAPPAEFAADLFWLLHQGHILLFTDDTLVVQEVREQSAPDASAPGEGKARKKKKKKKPAAAGESAGESPAEAADSPEEDESEAEAEGDTGPESAETPAEAGSGDSDDIATPTAAEEESPAPSTPEPEAAVPEAAVPEAAVSEATVPEEIAEIAAEPSFPTAPESPPSALPADSHEELSQKPSPGVDEPSGL